jgi:hypothetical protein
MSANLMRGASMGRMVFVPEGLGTSCLATIVLSLRDKIHLTAEPLLN